MLALHGTGAGSGIAIGKVRILRRATDSVPQYTIEPGQIESEIARLQAAVDQATQSLDALASQQDSEVSEEVMALLETHGQMLRDPMITSETMRLIREERVNAEHALSQNGARLVAAFKNIDDAYLSAKAIDVGQVVQRIQGALADSVDALSAQPEGAFDGEIIVSHDLTPADTIELRKHRIIGFLTNLGGPTSHTAILARSMKIPAVVGLHGAIRYLRDGDLLIVDGKRGVVMVGPDERALDAYQRRREKIFRRSQALESLRDSEAISLDGERISLFANVELPDEVELSMAQNSEGVGLYRTEFLFMNREKLPDEDEQIAVYRHLLERSGRPVTIRTLDLGADKQVDGGRSADNQITNPALGRRAIRLCLHDIGLFKPQLRAIYRASVFGDARMMVPMISSVEELNQLFRLIADIKLELLEQGHKFNDRMPVGGMIEVPAAAIAADIFASRLDFLSIGTNDLIQYTLAIDRIDDEVNYLYDPVHPSILRLVRNVIDAGRAANIPVSMCGEMAGDPLYTRILLALGLREFSMDPATLLEVKQRIRLSDIKKLQSALPDIMAASEPEELRQRVLALND